MAQPQWITPAGSLGTWPEGDFYSRDIEAFDPDGSPVYYQVIAGALPAGVQLETNGHLSGTARNIVELQGVAREVSANTTSQFVVRAYTTRVLLGAVVIDRLSDRTFNITVAGQDAPQWITPAGQLLSVVDGSRASFQLQFYDPDPDDVISLSLAAGQLPPGLSLDRNTGLISGIVLPLQPPPGSPTPGFDLSSYDAYPWDFTTTAEDQSFEFTVALSDGTAVVLRTFSIFVAVSRVNRPPLLLTPPGDLGTVRADNFFAFQFTGIDFDGQEVEFLANAVTGVGFDTEPFSGDFELFDADTYALPPGLTLNTETGWLSGYLPDSGLAEVSYKFVIQVRTAGFDSVLDPEFVSEPAEFTMTITGDVGTDTLWITPEDLGYINNGSVSTLAVQARNVADAELQYRLVPNTDSRLPPGLTLLPSGHIAGRTSFLTFALDGGFTTFDVIDSQRFGTQPTTFDQRADFTVQAYAPASATVEYQVLQITVTNGGSGYDPNNPPEVVIAAPPGSEGSIPATAGAVTIVDGVIRAIAVGNPGRGYRTAPAVTIGGAGGAAATAAIAPVGVVYAVSIFRRFTVQVRRFFNEPYQTLLMKALLDLDDRQRVADLLDPTAPDALIPYSSLYRPDDANFGIADSVVYPHALGLNALVLDDYIQAMELNHYWREITLGQVRSAVARDATGEVIYEVIYSPVIDSLVNNQGESVNLQVQLPQPVRSGSDIVTEVYPNSLDNMRDRIITGVGQVSPALPLWMTSRQADNSVLGFVPAWVLAYVKPGLGPSTAYRVQQGLIWQLNTLDFTVDRYELDRSDTCGWDPETQMWVEADPLTFDLNTQRLYPNAVRGPGFDPAPVTILSSGGVTNFTLSYTTPSPAIVVFVNGQLQQYREYTPTGVTGDYGVVLGLVNFEIQLQTAPPGSVTTYLGDGSTTDYAFTPIPGAALRVWLGAQPQVLGEDYVVVNAQVIFDTPPDPDVGVIIWQYSQIQVWQLRDVYTNDPASPYGELTTFDEGLTTFSAPPACSQGERGPNRYLLFPQREIIEPPNLGSAVVGWQNDLLAQTAWTNTFGNTISWINSGG